MQEQSQLLPQGDSHVEMEVLATSAAAALRTAVAATETGDHAGAAAGYGGAADLLERALFDTLCAKASALVAADSFDEARAAGARIVALRPRGSDGWYWQGMAAFKAGDGVRAKALFAKAVRFETDLVKKTGFMDWVERCEGLEAVETVDATAGDAPVAPEVAKVAKGPVAPEVAEKDVPVVPLPLKDATRMEWYQSPAFVTIDIYAKNVVVPESVVDIQAAKIMIRLHRPDKDTDYELDRELFSHVIPEESSWSASKFKVEVRLKKADPGVVWKALDKSAEVLSAAVQASSVASKRMEANEARQKGWDAVADAELKDYKEDDSTMALFRTIYAGADEDTRRAMMKSYSESGGQVLSTDWNDVKKKKVEYKEKD